MSRKEVEDKIKLYKIIIMLSKAVLLRNAENPEDKVRTIDTYTDIIANSKLEIRKLEYKLMNVYGVDIRSSTKAKSKRHTRRF